MTMATEKKAPAVEPEQGQDRVVMLSLRADGTPDQTSPVVIGDKEEAIEAAKRQFVEKALSDADEPHEAVAAAAEKRAVSVIGTLHKG